MLFFEWRRRGWSRSVEGVSVVSPGLGGARKLIAVAFWTSECSLSLSPSFLSPFSPLSSSPDTTIRAASAISMPPLSKYEEEAAEENEDDDDATAAEAMRVSESRGAESDPLSPTTGAGDDAAAAAAAATPPHAITVTTATAVLVVDTIEMTNKMDKGKRKRE